MAMEPSPAARFHTLFRMEKNGLATPARIPLDIGIPDGDALGNVVSYPNARRTFLRIGQDRFVAAYRNSVDRQLIGRRCGETMA